jgi:hypothetical protein
MLRYLRNPVGQPAHAQDSQEFWPEINAYVNLTPASRLYFVAAVGKEEDIPTLQGDFGAREHPGQPAWRVRLALDFRFTLFLALSNAAYVRAQLFNPLLQLHALSSWRIFLRQQILENQPDGACHRLDVSSTKHMELEPYFEYQHDTSKSIASRVEVGGVVLSLYF